MTFPSEKALIILPEIRSPASMYDHKLETLAQAIRSQPFDTCALQIATCMGDNAWMTSLLLRTQLGSSFEPAIETDLDLYEDLPRRLSPRRGRLSPRPRSSPGHNTTTRANLDKVRELVWGMLDSDEVSGLALVMPARGANAYVRYHWEEVLKNRGRAREIVEGEAIYMGPSRGRQYRMSILPQA